MRSSFEAFFLLLLQEVEALLRVIALPVDRCVTFLEVACVDGAESAAGGDSPYGDEGEVEREREEAEERSSRLSSLTLSDTDESGVE